MVNTKKSIKVKFVIGVSFAGINREEVIEITEDDCNLDEPYAVAKYCDDVLCTLVDNYSDNYWEMVESN